MRYYVILLLALLASISFATNGVTIRELVENFSCFKQNRHVYAMVRAYINTGQVDPNARKTLIAAQNAKLLYQNAYMNPCTQCKFMPEVQIDQIVEALKGIKYETIWIQVQLMDRWSANATYNCEYVKRLIAQTKKHKQSSGIASDAPAWEKIMGKDCIIPDDDVGVWWIKHDNEESFDHFKPFGGFTYPTIKEFEGPVKMCGFEVDRNFCNC